MVRMIEWAFSRDAPGYINGIAFVSTLATTVGAVVVSAACLMVGYWWIPVPIWIVAIIAAAYKRRDK